jgi:hypothetical protein
MNLDKLKKTAELADKGPWRCNLLDVVSPDGVVSRSWGCRGKYQLEEMNAAHIAAFDPPTALKLVALAASHQRLKEALSCLIDAMRFRAAVLAASEFEKLDFANSKVWEAEDSADAALKDAP